MKVLTAFLGKKYLQSFSEKLYKVALKGMNYGSASSYHDNGELVALKEIAKLFPDSSSINIFDVGANVGHYTKQIATAFASLSYKLHVFEPSLPTFLKLKENCKEVRNVQFHQMGMSDRPGEATLYYEKESSGLSSLYERDLGHHNIEMKHHEQVPLTTLDNFCSSHQIERIHFLKMDVEGHELAVLKGAELLLKNNAISVIQFEFGGCNIDSKTNFHDFYKLFSTDYKLYRILKDGLYPIKKYSEYQEIYVSANYMAIHKSLASF